MTERKLNEAQMREYVENEVRKALMSEELDESMTDEGILNWLSKLVGGGPEGGFGSRISMEGIIGAILGHIAIAPIMTKLLNAIGIPADGALGQFILKRVSEVGGYTLGQWVDKKWDPVGLDNKSRDKGGFLGLGGETSGSGGR